MKQSEYLSQAHKILEAAATTSLSPEDRAQQAIQLAQWMLEEATATCGRKERKRMHELAQMMKDPHGKVFTTLFTDQCFRSRQSKRAADQLCYLLKRFGIPQFLSPVKRLGMRAFQTFSPYIPQFTMPVAQQMVRKEMRHVIVPGEPIPLEQYLCKRKKQKIHVNFNHLGEAILGEEEAEKRTQLYIDALANDSINYVSVKVSSICSQINLLAYEETLERVKERLRRLYRTAQEYPQKNAAGQEVPKFINLDMEEYRDLNLTVDVFQQLLDEEEFHQLPAGIVLQAYLPDSFLIQQSLTEWALKRTEAGRSFIKIRLVKGANLAMEQVDAALHSWPQAPYPSKVEVDANYKRMLIYGCRMEHARAVHLGIGSHNLFDISYALLLRKENGVEAEVDFEMLEGMADHLRRVVQRLADSILLYSPVALEQEFQTAVAYLMRRLDENTAPQNFLRHSFGLSPGSEEWKKEEKRFRDACALIDNVSQGARRSQDRTLIPSEKDNHLPFENEPDTDFSLPKNQEWARHLIQQWRGRGYSCLPLSIGNQQLVTEETRANVDPSHPQEDFYRISLASSEQINQALEIAEKARDSWRCVHKEEKAEILLRVADNLRKNRSSFVGVMLVDGGKTLAEADVELSEAIDFAEYYARSMLQWSAFEPLRWKPKGTVLVTPPWNFPCAIPLGGVLAALVTGNTVIFKPAVETALVAWYLATSVWEAGVPKEALQFVTCKHEQGSQMIQDPRISAVILTGGTETAEHFLNLRPSLHLMAETGGKNALIVTSMADRDLAIKDCIQSAFGHSGQKCSAASLLILEKEIYDDAHFLEQLKDAAASLKVGSAWDPATMVNPLIRPPKNNLKKGLTELEEGEHWLLQPQQDPTNPHLWSPGIKVGVKSGAFTHLNELFGPVLSVMRAENLDHAIDLANAVPYGLTAGLHSLDEREHAHWLQKMEAGNYYINRGITGAIVQRQPFGGCKRSSFGHGSKAGGPNYLLELMVAEEEGSAFKEGASFTTELRAVGKCLPKDQKHEWEQDAANYTFWWLRHFRKKHDPSRLQGQDNFFSYRPYASYTLRLQEGDSTIDICRVIAAAYICGTPLELSGTEEQLDPFKYIELISRVWEDEEKFLQRIENKKIQYLRLLKAPLEVLRQALVKGEQRVFDRPISRLGRLELLNYTREISVSVNYHRYGNLGEREAEPRRELPLS